MFDNTVDTVCKLNQVYAVARLAQSVEHQTFKADFHSESSEGQGFESLIGRYFFVSMCADKFESPSGDIYK